MRTQENDNDIAKKYFRDPAVLIQQQTTAMVRGSDDIDGNTLIQKLRQQSIDNREKNDLYVARKTFEADQVRCIVRFLFCNVDYLSDSSWSYIWFAIVFLLL
jgi:hypothetical protein